MVVDLRHVNDFAQPGSAEVETLSQLQLVARPQDYMVALDLSDGYYHFRVHEKDAGFFQIDTPTGLYQIDALNMGWTRSPQVFTDALRPVVRELRRRGIRILWYLDDFLICGETPKARINLATHCAVGHRSRESIMCSLFVLCFWGFPFFSI